MVTLLCSLECLQRLQLIRVVILTVGNVNRMISSPTEIDFLPLEFGQQTQNRIRQIFVQGNLEEFETGQFGLKFQKDIATFQ